MDLPHRGRPLPGFRASRAAFALAFVALPLACGGGGGGGSSPAAALALSVSAVDFGEVPTGTVAQSAPIEVRNVSAAALRVAASLSGEGYEHDLAPTLLAPGAAVAFHVRLVAQGEGPRIGLLSVGSGGNHPGASATLSGQVVCVPYTQPLFSKSSLVGAAPVLPTSLQFGPDGRLYVAQQDGTLLRYGVQRTARNAYAVTSTEVIDLVRQLPNHDDQGAPAPAVVARQVTGLLVAGSASQPVVYVTSSDPRIANAVSTEADTNSGVLSRLTWNGAGWERRDLVRGLPRSREAHGPNGLALDAAANVLYLAQGGNTNMGAPSNVFGHVPEYALSAAILSIDLAAIGAGPYDLPTLDDEDRPGNPDANDPFGGNEGKNQARLVPGGPVQVHSPGWRNPYDLVLTTGGLLFAIDNGPNAAWGGTPPGTPQGACSNAPNDHSPSSHPDNLHRVGGPGYYAGTPNPTRASAANTFNASNPQSPVPWDNPVECEYRVPGLAVSAGGDGALATWPYSTNGLTEYRASNFQGALRGDLLATSFDATLQRIDLDAQGDVAQVSTLFFSVGSMPLDVTAQGEGEHLPGTVWVADLGAARIWVFEPIDYDSGCGAPCSGANSSALDEDGDGFSNADEIANGTSPCSPADVPPDHDGDSISDLLDPDDDNDGRPDTSDLFAWDSLDGAGTPPPLIYSWDGNDPGFGLLSLGFTGLMSDGVSDYAKLFDLDLATAGGASGKLTLDSVRAGDALGLLNTQRSAFQLGVALSPAAGPVRVRTRVVAPFFNGLAPQDFQSLGLFVGTGPQDDYLRLCVAALGGAGGLEVVLETAAAPQTATLAAPVLAAAWVDLELSIDPAAGAIQPRYGLPSGAMADAGPSWILPQGSALRRALSGQAAVAVGVIATSRMAPSFAATWDFIEVLPGL